MLLSLIMLLHDFLLVLNDVVVDCLLQRCLFQHSLTFFNIGCHEDIIATITLLLRHRRLVEHLLSALAVFQRGLIAIPDVWLRL